MVPAGYRVSAMSYGWMFFWIIGGNSTLLSPIIGDAFDNGTEDRDGSGLQIALVILYLGGMSLAALFFVLGTFLFQQEKKSTGYSAEYTALSFDMMLSQDTDEYLVPNAFRRKHKMRKVIRSDRVNEIEEVRDSDGRLNPEEFSHHSEEDDHSSDGDKEKEPLFRENVQ
jgi:hypothetical protein